MLLEAQQHHFSAFVVKDHYYPTMLSAYIAEKYVGDGSCRVFGGIALNNSVGGINLKAVDAAVAMGAKLVWMPTVSAPWRVSCASSPCCRRPAASPRSRWRS